MSTIPSPNADRPHDFRGARHQGQGEQRYCRWCGAREAPPEMMAPCLPQAQPPRGVRSDYDPLA